MNTREDFDESWLSESPEMIPATELIDMLEYNIKDRIDHGSAVTAVKDNFFKIGGGQTLYYWHQENGKITLAAEFTQKPQSLIVNGVGKRTKGKQPFASDLYALVLQDQGSPIRIVSDVQLSEEGLNVWTKLLNMGYSISVYDSVNPGQSLQQIKSGEELKQFLKFDDSAYRRYQYIVSENNDVLAETRSFFNTRRMRELSGML